MIETVSVHRRVAAMLLVALSRTESTVSIAARNHEAELRTLFYRATRNSAQKVVVSKLQQMIGAHSSATVIHYLDEDGVFSAFTDTFIDNPLTHIHNPFRNSASGKKLPAVLKDTLKAGGNASPLDMRFDVSNPEAIAWAESHAGDLVTQLSLEQRTALRSVISDGLSEGLSPRTTAQIVKASVGLTERDSLAVMNRQVSLLANGVSNTIALERAEKYASKLLTTRAKTISQHETMTAANEGQRQLWRQAESKGLLDGTERKALIQADPCPICTQASDEIVGINEEFSIGLPPFHVRCRCTEGIV